MKDLNLDEGKVKYQGQWYTAEVLTNCIQNRMLEGDMKISGMAQALERLSRALENSHPIEVRLVLTSEEYENLKAIAKTEDDRECIRKAIAAFVSASAGKSPKKERRSLIDQLANATGGNNTTPGGEKPKTPKIEADNTAASGSKFPSGTIQCFKCKTTIEIPKGQNPHDIQCPNCSTSSREPLKNDDSSIRYKDHFLG